MTVRTKSLAILLAASALAVPQVASAATAREKALEARLEKLEAEMMRLRSDLGAAREAQAQSASAVEAAAVQAAQAAQVAAARSEETATKMAALQAKPVPAMAAADGFKVGGTTFKMGGFAKVVASSTRFGNGELAGGSLGKEFYLPQQIPVGGGPSRDFIGHARQTRLFLSAATPVAGKEIKAHIEWDFALATAPLGAQRATNAYSPTFRRGFITYGNLLIGQEWSTFQNPAHLPESTDFVGPMDGAIFVRQMMVQYRQKLANGFDLYLAAENPQTETETPQSPALVDNDQDRVPDFVAKLAWKGSVGELHVAGLVRQLSVHTGGKGDDSLGWGLTGGGKLLFGPEQRHDLRFLVAYGRGIGRYFTVGFAPDAIYDTTADAHLHPVRNLAGFAALKLGWTGSLRSTAMVGFQRASYPDDIAIAAMSNLEAYSVAGNLFWSPVKNFDLGVEFRHARRKVFSGLTGTMDRIELAAKYSF